MACTFLDYMESCYYSSQSCFEAERNQIRDCEHCLHKPKPEEKSLSQEVLQLAEDDKFWEDAD